MGCKTDNENLNQYCGSNYEIIKYRREVGRTTIITLRTKYKKNSFYYLVVFRGVGKLVENSPAFRAQVRYIVNDRRNNIMTSSSVIKTHEKWVRLFLTA